MITIAFTAAAATLSAGAYLRWATVPVRIAYAIGRQAGRHAR